MTVKEALAVLAEARDAHLTLGKQKNSGVENRGGTVTTVPPI